VYSSRLCESRLGLGISVTSMILCKLCDGLFSSSCHAVSCSNLKFTLGTIAMSLPDL
jgi:hypothetical protein